MLVRATALVVVLLAAVACGRGVSPAEASAMAEPYVTRFEPLDRWARRTVDARVAMRTERQQEEIAFTPVRGSRDVVAAWVEIRGASTRVMHYGDIDAPPTDVAWTDLADRSLRVARFTLNLGRRSIPCVLLSRARTAAGGETVTVTAAYSPSQAQRSN